MTAKPKVQTSAKSKRTRAPRIISPFEEPAAKQSTVGERLRKKKAEATYTIAAAFNFFTMPVDSAPGDNGEFENFNFERAIRAIGFLLQWSSQIGNESLEGNIANGFGYLLDYTANQFEYVKADYERQLDALRDDLRRAAERPEDRK